MSAPTLRPMSVEEYLRTEEVSPFKREYVGGFVYALHGSTPDTAGTTAAHNLIGLNIVAALHDLARQRGHSLYAFDLRLYVASSECFSYPDVMLTLPEAAPDLSATYATDPCLLVEIISDNSVERDRQAKYAAYTALPSLQTYLIVEQAERRVYAYQREGKTWKLEELASSGSLDLPCLGRSLTLDEIYADVAV